jgi:hypothetical protein
VTAAPAVRPAFAHASEAELARILDFYQVRWTYEPDTFPIGWSLTGDVVESFSPDFYLPDLDLYVELTTLKQKLVRKKNRKLRRLRELYPDIRIKLFYARDFRALLLKFGRLALLDDLTGTTGQATPPRTAERIVSEAGAAAGLRSAEMAAAAVRPDEPAAGLDAMADEGDDETSDMSPSAPRVTVAAPAALVHPPSPPRGRRRGRRRRREDASPVDALAGSTVPRGPEQPA